MIDEYGDMDQVAGDFVDWFAERWFYFEVKKIELHHRFESAFQSILENRFKRLFGR